MLKTLPPTSGIPLAAYAESLCPAEETFVDWANLVRAEYCEMPGLSLTEGQVERLWQLNPALAKALLTRLIDAGFLRCTSKGTYIRADGGVH